MKHIILASAVLAAVSTGSAKADQIILNSGSIIGNTGSYDGRPAVNIVDQQTGQVSDLGSLGQYQYWINSEGGPANAYITIDLGAQYAVSSFDLFNTHNEFYGDRGTGNFYIFGANAVALDGTNGFTLAGPTTTLVAGTLAAAPVNDPIASQSFASGSTAGFRYLQFRPTTEASVNTHCCSSHEYGLSEFRVFGGIASTGTVPEPASWAMMFAGFGIVGAAMRRRTLVVVAA